MAQKNKFYVVWIGLETGVYDSWEKCKQQINNWKGAIYKGFATREEADEAYSQPPELYVGKNKEKRAASPIKNSGGQLPDNIPLLALAVDAACSGNPGQMEYRGVLLAGMKQVFHFGPTLGTNNIGEFLAIVHGLALLKRKGYHDWTIFSDSRTALSWVRQKKCKTKLERNSKTEELFQIIERAEHWLQTNSYNNPVLKWDTEKLGEIPADFGRK